MSIPRSYRPYVSRPYYFLHQLEIYKRYELQNLHGLSSISEQARPEINAMDAKLQVQFDLTEGTFWHWWRKVLVAGFHSSVGPRFFGGFDMLVLIQSDKRQPSRLRLEEIRRGLHRHALTRNRIRSPIIPAASATVFRLSGVDRIGFGDRNGERDDCRGGDGEIRPRSRPAQPASRSVVGSGGLLCRVKRTEPMPAPPDPVTNFRRPSPPWPLPNTSKGSVTGRPRRTPGRLLNALPGAL